MQWQMLMGPLMGAFIGYITNDIAVRMLFRPRVAKYICGRRVPFTPGLIPKGRERLASALGDVIARELLSPEVLEQTLLSDDMMHKVNQALDQAMDAMLCEVRTPRMMLEGISDASSIASVEASAKRAAGIFIMEKILESGIENIAAQAAVSETKARMKASAAAPLVLLLDDRRSAALGDKLSQVMREMIATSGPAAIEQMLDDSIGGFLDTPVGELLHKHADAREGIHTFAMAQYQGFVHSSMPSLLRTLDIAKIVEDKLNGLSAKEIEQLILGLMKKELQAIVWLGALLGGIMGLVNTFVSV